MISLSLSTPVSANIYALPQEDSQDWEMENVRTLVRRLHMKKSCGKMNDNARHPFSDTIQSHNQKHSQHQPYNSLA